jgi:group I intron endonuclease
MIYWSYYSCSYDCNCIPGFIFVAQNGYIILQVLSHTDLIQEFYLSASLPLISSPRLSTILFKWNITPLAVWENLHLPSLRQEITSTIKPLAGIYLVVNLVNGKMYVGSAVAGKMHTRFGKHLFSLHGSKLIAKGVTKYGLNNFAFVLIETYPGFNPKLHNQALLGMETGFITDLNTVIPHGYNIAPTGTNTSGVLHTVATRAAMVVNYSEERKAMIGALNRGKQFSPDTIAKMRAAALLRPPMSDGTRELISLNSTVANLYEISLLNGVPLPDESLSIFIRTRDKVGEYCDCDSRTVKRALNSNGIIKHKWLVKWIGKAKSK